MICCGKAAERFDFSLLLNGARKDLIKGKSIENVYQFVSYTIQHFFSVSGA